MRRCDGSHLRHRAAAYSLGLTKRAGAELQSLLDGLASAPSARAIGIQPDSLPAKLSLLSKRADPIQLAQYTKLLFATRSICAASLRPVPSQE